MASTVEKRLEKLEVYLPETLKDIEDRLNNVEEALEPYREAGSVENKIKHMEAEWNKIPPRLITNWTEVENIVIS